VLTKDPDEATEKKVICHNRHNRGHNRLINCVTFAQMLQKMCRYRASFT